MMKAFQGRCHTCGSDDGSDRSGGMLPISMKRYLQENARYLVRIDTGHPSPEYACEWDVAHWIGGAFNQHIRGKVTHFHMVPLPDALTSV